MKRVLTTSALALSLAALAGQASAEFDCADGAITLGFAKSQTNFFAFFDVAGMQGAQVAIDALNAEGGIDGCPIEIVAGNTRSDPGLAMQVANELIAEGAEIIITPADFDVGVGASLAAQEAGVLSVSFEASSSDWATAVGPNHFTMAITEDDQARAMAAFAAEQGWSAPYIVTNGAFNVFTATQKAFESYLEGETVDVDIVADDATDYSAVISKISEADGADFIFLNDYFPHVGTFIRQLRAAGIELPVLGNQNYSSPAMLETLGAEGLQGVYYISQGFFEGPTASEEALAFVDGYTEIAGNYPENANTLAGYEGMMLLAEGLKAAGTTDAAAVTEAITSLGEVALATSTVATMQDRRPVRSAAVITYDADAGDYVLYSTIAPAGS